MAKIVNADGSVSDIDDSDLPDAQEAGAQIATPEDIRIADRHDRLGGAGGAALATGAGVARGLTFGLSDAAGRAVGLGDNLRDLQEEHSGLSTAGEITGAIAPTLLSGGLGAAAEGGSLAARGAGLAGILPRAVSGLGSAVEHGIGGLLAREGAGLAERAAVKGLGLGAAGATEGAFYGAGHEISDAALDDHELTAAKMIAGIGDGAMWGAIAGGGAGAGLEVLGSAGRAIASRLPESLSEALEAKSGEMAWRSAGGTQKMLEKAEKSGIGYREMGQQWVKEAPEFAGKSSFAEMKRPDLVEASENGMKHYGDKLGSQLDELSAKAAENDAKIQALAAERRASEAAADDAATGVRDPSASPSSRAQDAVDKVQNAGLPRAADAYQAIMNVADDVGAKIGNTSIANKVRGWAQQLAEQTGMLDAKTGELVANAGDAPMSLRQLRDLRIDIDHQIYTNLELSPAKKQLVPVRQALEKMLEDKVSAISEAKGLEAYKSNKRGFQVFSSLNQAATKGVAKQGNNLALSLTDRIAGGAGLVAGGVLGGHVGAAVGSGLASLGNKFVRERGDFIGAQLLHNVGQLGALENIGATVDKRIAGGVKAFLEGGEASRGPAKATQRELDAYKSAAMNVAQHRTNPEGLLGRVQGAVGDSMGQVAPETHRSAMAKVSTIVTNLANRAPLGRTNTLGLTPHLEETRFSEAELLKFGRYADGAVDPISVLDDMKGGHLSADKVDALREGHPEIYAEIQDALIDGVTKHGDRLSYDRKVQLSTLFGVPLDETMDPGFISRIQAGKSAPPANDNAPQSPGQTSKRPVKMDTSVFATSAQKVEQGNVR